MKIRILVTILGILFANLTNAQNIDKYDEFIKILKDISKTNGKKLDCDFDDF